MGPGHVCIKYSRLGTSLIHKHTHRHRHTLVAYTHSHVHTTHKHTCTHAHPHMHTLIHTHTHTHTYTHTSESMVLKYCCEKSWVYVTHGGDLTIKTRTHPHDFNGMLILSIPMMCNTPSILQFHSVHAFRLLTLHTVYQ